MQKTLARRRSALWISQNKGYPGAEQLVDTDYASSARDYRSSGSEASDRITERRTHQKAGQGAWMIVQHGYQTKKVSLQPT